MKGCTFLCMRKNTRLFVRVSAEQKARIVKAAAGRRSVAAFLLNSAECRIKWGGVLRAVGAAEDRGFKKSAITASITRALAQL
jgi:hypothetical protein